MAEHPAALLAERQAFVPVEIGRRAWHAMGNQIGRAGDDHAPHFAEPDADQTGVGEFADADGAVDVLVDQIDQTVGEVEIDRHLRVRLHEFADQRRHVLTAETRRRRHLEMTAGTHAAERHRGLGIGQIIEQALAVFKKGLPLEGNGQLARGAQQQLDAEACLQRVDAAADDCRRHILRPRCRRQAAARGHGDKGFDLLQTIHGDLFDTLSNK